MLLLNLGTPDATDYWSMRRYLKEFLSDRRVIEVPRLMWWPILNLVILTFGPAEKARTTTRSGTGSATRVRSRPSRVRRRRQLNAALADARIVVDWAMRYANPTVASRIAALKEQGCDRILLVPLYPQYAGASWATACDQAFRALMALRWQPAIRVAPPYYEDPAYIEAIAASIREHLAAVDFEPEAIVASFHGMPQKYLELGDPYHCQCQKTSRLVREKLDWPAERWHTTFQSQFGNDPWLQPYTIESMERLAKSGIKRLAIISPGFSADCLETLEELDMENRAKFMEHGGEKFTYIPCLNDSPLGMRAIEQIVRRELAGWI